jgi:hypothetical protein
MIGVPYTVPQRNITSFSDCGFPVNYLRSTLFRCFQGAQLDITARQPFNSAASSGQVPKPRSGAPRAMGKWLGVPFRDTPVVAEPSFVPGFRLSR